MKPIHSRTTLLVLILALATGTLWAASRSAEDYLHGGGSKYIQGRLQEASVDVDEGLRHYPNDSRLRILAAQLKSLKDQKKQDQGESGSQDGEDPKSKEDKKDSTGEGSQQKKDEDQKDKEKQDQEEKKESPQEDKDQRDSSHQEAVPAKPGEMSKEEAERLLNSYQDDEKREHQQMQKRQRRPVGSEKDW